MNIAEILRIHATARPMAAAIIDARRGRTRTLTFAGLDRASARAAHVLRRAGLRPGDTVMVFHPMSAELYIALTALLRLGLVAMFMDPWAGRAHIEHCCSLSPPRALIASPRAHLLRLLSPALRRIPLKFSIALPVPGAVTLGWGEGGAVCELVEPCLPETPALLTFTSGSTGRPKAAVRTHRFLLAQHRALEQTMELTPGEVDLATLPIFVLANLASGVTSLIPNADLLHPGTIDPGPVVAQIDAHQPARMAASPAFLERLADYCAYHNRTLRGVRKIFTGGAPVFPRLLHRLRSAAPGAEITAVYGSTEAEPIAHIAYRAIKSEDIAAMLGGRGLLAGFPIPAIELKILPDRWGGPVGPYTRTEFEAACLPPGQAGEIVISGPHVLGGYLGGHGNEESKFSVDAARWHRTGDAGYLDDRGRLWLLGRCAARIENASGTVYPFTIECAAYQHPGVRRAAVASYQGRRILALELSGGVANADLTRFTQTLAWARIDEIQIHKQIPVDKRHNAKIDYPALRRLVGK